MVNLKDDIPGAVLGRLIAKAIHGDQAAWNSLFEVYRPILSTWAFKLNDRIELSNSDIVQEAWLRIVSGLKTFKGVPSESFSNLQISVEDGSPESYQNSASCFYVWVRGVARNAMLNHLEAEAAQKRRPRNSDQIDDSQIEDRDRRTPSAIVAGFDDQSKIRLVLKNIPCQLERQIILMSFWDGLSLRSISSALGIEYSALRRKYHRILTEMQSDFDGMAD